MRHLHPQGRGGGREPAHRGSRASPSRPRRVRGHQPRRSVSSRTQATSTSPCTARPQFGRPGSRGPEELEAGAEIGLAAVHDKRLPQQGAKHQVVKVRGQRMARDHGKPAGRELRGQPPTRRQRRRPSECPTGTAGTRRARGTRTGRGPTASRSRSLRAAGTSPARRGSRPAPRTGPHEPRLSGSPSRHQPPRERAPAPGARGRCRARRARAAPATPKHPHRRPPGYHAVERRDRRDRDVVAALPSVPRQLGGSARTRIMRPAGSDRR